MADLDDDDTRGAEPRWDELGKIMKSRREVMRLPQDLSSRGGPGEITTRKIERGDGVSVQRRMWSKLERALSMKEGAVDRILDGTATDEDLDPNHRFAYAASAIGIASAASVTGRLEASMPAPTAQMAGVIEPAGRFGTMFLTVAPDGAQQFELTGTTFVNTEEKQDVLRRFGFDVTLGDSFTADESGATVVMTLPPATADDPDPKPVITRRGTTQYIHTKGIPSAEAFGNATITRVPAVPAAGSETAHQPRVVTEDHAAGVNLGGLSGHARGVATPSTLQATSDLIDRLTREPSTPAIDDAMQALLKALPDLAEMQKTAAAMQRLGEDISARFAPIREQAVNFNAAMEPAREALRAATSGLPLPAIRHMQEIAAAELRRREGEGDEA